MKTSEENLLRIANINLMLEILSDNPETVNLHKAGTHCIALLNSNKKINENTEPLIVNFYLATYKYYLISDELISNPELLKLLNNGPEAALLESFKFALARQLEITANIKNNLDRDPEQDRQLCDMFINNLCFIRAQKNNITNVFNPFIRQTIAEYFLSYLEFLNDHGWTICFPEYELSEEQRKTLKQNPTLLKSHEPALARNFEEFKQFFREYAKESAQFHWGNKQSLENLLLFCNNIKLTANDKFVCVNDWLRLVDAIKTERLVIIEEIVITDPTIIATSHANNFCDDEKNFTPLMIAAKYCQDEDVLKTLLAPQKTKKEKTNHITLRPTDSSEPINTYNSLMIAARWGSPLVFEYLLSIISSQIKTLDNVKLLVECICFNYLPVDQTLRNTVLTGLTYAILTDQRDCAKWLGKMPLNAAIKEKIYSFQAIKLEALAPLLKNVSKEMAKLEVPASPVRAFKEANLAVIPRLILLQTKRKTEEVLKPEEPAADNESSSFNSTIIKRLKR
ncbi:MAG: hypothetical protein V4501_01840 [Pseudomonadota bacterium]